MVDKQKNRNSVITRNCHNSSLSRNDRVTDARIMYAELLSSGTASPLKVTADRLSIPRGTVRRWKHEGRLGELSNEQLQAVADAYTQHDDEKLAAAAIGIPVSACTYQIRQAALRGMLGTKPVLPGFKISKATAFKDQDGAVVREVITQKPDLPLADFSKIPAHQVLHNRESSTLQYAMPTV